MDNINKRSRERTHYDGREWFPGPLQSHKAALVLYKLSDKKKPNNGTVPREF